MINRRQILTVCITLLFVFVTVLASYHINLQQLRQNQLRQDEQYDRELDHEIDVSTSEKKYDRLRTKRDTETLSDDAPKIVQVRIRDQNKKLHLP